MPIYEFTCPREHKQDVRVSKYDVEVVECREPDGAGTICGLPAYRAEVNKDQAVHFGFGFTRSHA